MSLQPSRIYFCPWQMSQSAFFQQNLLCSYILIENRERVKSLGMARVLGNARAPRTDKAGKCPAVARGGGSGRRWNWLMHDVVLFCFCFVLASCLGHLKGKCMTKLMRVCIANNQRIDSRKCTSTETLEKNKKTLMLVFRCWHYKNKRTKSAEIVWGNKWISNIYFQ